MGRFPSPWRTNRAETVKPGILHPFVVWVFRRPRTTAPPVSPQTEGLENSPGKTLLLVANHSAGVAIAEILCFAMLYAGHFKNLVPLLDMLTKS